MPRFVVLEHDWPTPHWDLLLEAGPVLKAWRLLAEPRYGEAVRAEPNFDHRLVYLEFEGPLTGDRGAVQQWDTGTFEGDLKSAGWRIHMNGVRLRGFADMTWDDDGWHFHFIA